MIELRIKNWDDFNPRKDVKSASWFRFDNSFFTNPTFFNATSDTKIIWCYLLCCASQKMSGKIKISKEMISALLRIDENKVNDGINFLISSDCIELTTQEYKQNNINKIGSDRDIQSNFTEMSATNERTNERTDNTPLDLSISQSENSSFCETENQELQINPNQAKSKKSLIHKSNIQSKLEFIYSIYPRKERKKKGFETLSKLSIEELDRVELSVKNYALICEYEKKEKQYIRQFSTFANSWEDFYEASPDEYKTPAMVAEERIDAALELYKQQAEC